MPKETVNDRSIAAWDLLERGDRDAADALWQALCSEAPDAPSVVGLGAALLASAADPEGAVRELLRAAALAEAQERDATDSEPTPDSPLGNSVRFFLDAAELQLYALDDPGAAIESCQRALDLASDDDELIEGVLLEAESYLVLGDSDDLVRELLAELEACSIDDPNALCRAGDQYAIMGDLEQAARYFSDAVALDDGFAEAHHGLGLVYEVQGRTDEQVQAWLRVREIDMTEPRPEWQLSDEAIEEVVDSALSELPDDVRALLGNVPMFIEDAPDEQLIRDGMDPRLLGLFSGQPLPHQSHIVDGQQPTLERIQLFSRNLERASVGPRQFRDELRITVLHETAHFFGLDDHELHAIGLG